MLSTEAYIFILFTQITLAGGEERKEVFIHSLELGHAAVIRAFKDMGECPPLHYSTVNRTK